MPAVFGKGADLSVSTMEAETPFDYYRAAFRRVFQAHCAQGAPYMQLSELLRFCSNTHIFPVQCTQDLISSQEVKRLCQQVSLDDSRLTFPQFDRLLRLLAARCFTANSDRASAKALIAYIKPACKLIYNLELVKDAKDDQDNSSLSARNSFGLDLAAMGESETIRSHRYSENQRNSSQFRPTLKIKAAPRLTQKLSLPGFSKAMELRHIYDQKVIGKRSPGSDARLQIASPKSTTSRGSKAMDVMSPKGKTPLASFATRVHYRHESAPLNFLSAVKSAVDRFQANFDRLKTTKRPRGLSRRGEAFVKHLHARRVQMVRAR